MTAKDAKAAGLILGGFPFFVFPIGSVEFGALACAALAIERMASICRGRVALSPARGEA